MTLPNRARNGNGGGLAMRWPSCSTTTNCAGCPKLGSGCPNCLRLLRTIGRMGYTPARYSSPMTRATQDEPAAAVTVMPSRVPPMIVIQPPNGACHV